MLESGVPNLDLILGGGIPEGDVLLVVGPAGAGKTTLCFQIAFHAASREQNVLYVSTLSEPPFRLLQHLRSFAFYDETLIGKRVLLLSVYPLIKQGLEAVADALVKAAREHQATLVLVDGLMTMRDLQPGTVQLRTFIYDLRAILATLNCTTLVTSSGTERGTEQHFPEYTMADGVLELGRQDLGTQTVRTIRTNKMRGLSPLLGQHSFRIDRAGLTVFPRLESAFEPADVGLRSQRVSLGLGELDGMMQGGPLAGSITLLAGALGTGKTFACLHFLMEGVPRGEKGLLVGFRETPRQLVDKAREFGLDLEAAINRGQVAIFHRHPADLVIDEVAWALLDKVDHFAPQRLALDSVTELEEAVEDRRRRGHMATLASMLRIRGVTSLVTKEIAQVVGPELDFGATPLAVLAENLVLFRYVEFRGELYRIVSVLKMRDSDCDRSIRQYTIGKDGLRVLRKMETSEGLLTGIARLPSEVRVKR